MFRLWLFNADRDDVDQMFCIQKNHCTVEKIEGKSKPKNQKKDINLAKLVPYMCENTGERQQHTHSLRMYNTVFTQPDLHII